MNTLEQIFGGGGKVHDEKAGHGIQDQPGSAHIELVRRLQDGIASARLTKVLLARRTRLSRGTVSAAFTTNAALPSPTTVAALARALGLEEQDLLDLRRKADGQYRKQHEGEPDVGVDGTGVSGRHADGNALPDGTVDQGEQSMTGEAAARQRPVAAEDTAKAERVISALPPQAGWLTVLRNPNVVPIHYEAVVVTFGKACGRLRKETSNFLDPELHPVYNAMIEALFGLEDFMAGHMCGPDQDWPWRDLTRHPVQRRRDLPELAAARVLFGRRYREMVNLLNARGLLPLWARGVVDQPVSDQELEQRRAQTEGVRSVLTMLGALPASPAEQFDRWVKVMTVESVVKQLGVRDDDGANAWEEKRRALISELRVTAADVADTGVRTLLEQVRLVLLTCQGPWEVREQQESRTRDIAIGFAIESVGAFRRGEPLPAPPLDYARTLGDVSNFIKEWNSEGQ